MYTPLIALGVIAVSFALGAAAALVLGLAPGAVFAVGGACAIGVTAATAARFTRVRS